MIDPLELLYEAPDLPAMPLPADIAEIYRGSLGFARPRLFSNFVTTIDGVAAIPSVPGSVQVIGGGVEADRFVMALLRASADALLMGARTFQQSREASWNAASLFPQAAGSFAALRRRLGSRDEPLLAVVTAGGTLDPTLPALETGIVVLTSDVGARQLEGRLPSASTVHSLGREVALDGAVQYLRAAGCSLILTEGGPTLHGSLLSSGLVDELFLTVAPALAGHTPERRELGIVEGLELRPAGVQGRKLMGVRRHGEYLFLRYALGGPSSAAT